MADTAAKIETNATTIKCTKFHFQITATSYGEGIKLAQDGKICLPDNPESLQSFLLRAQLLIEKEAEIFCNELAIENSVAPNTNS